MAEGPGGAELLASWWLGTRETVGKHCPHPTRSAVILVTTDIPPRRRQGGELLDLP